MHYKTILFILLLIANINTINSCKGTKEISGKLGQSFTLMEKQKIVFPNLTLCIEKVFVPSSKDLELEGPVTSVSIKVQDSLTTKIIRFLGPIPIVEKFNNYTITLIHEDFDKKEFVFRVD